MSVRETAARMLGGASAVVLRWASSWLALGDAAAGTKRWAGVPERAAYPEVAVLFVDRVPVEARRAFEVFTQEARTWRTLAEIDAGRARAWSSEGRRWDAAVCAGRAQVFREAADNLEEVLMDSLELWEQYERQVSEGGR